MGGAAPITHDEDRPWRWRNCREVVLSVRWHLLPWQWHISAEWAPEVYSTFGYIQFGPLGLAIWADIGNCSTGDWRARFGLSESEAWERAR